MLSNADYDLLWTSLIPSGFQQKLPVSGDSYINYCEREEMFEDYLDIFRGYSTRGTGRRSSSKVKRKQHPFFDKEGLPVHKFKAATKPKINHILVGEAAPNRGVNYFYDTTAIAGQGYLIEIFNAEYRGVGPGFTLTTPLTTPNKIRALIDLAYRGVILLDLFPFATDYTAAGVDRRRLTLDGVTSSFWAGPRNPYNFIDRLRDLYLVNKGIFARDLDVTIGFVAPPIISHFLAGNINSGVYPIPAGATLQVGHNDFGIRAIPIRNNFFYRWPAGSFLNTRFAKPASVNNVPIYQCCAYGPAMTIPHRLFISNAMR